jgi:hypothetical protein
MTLGRARRGRHSRIKVKLRLENSRATGERTTLFKP